MKYYKLILLLNTICLIYSCTGCKGGYVAKKKITLETDVPTKEIKDSLSNSIVENKKDPLSGTLESALIKPDERRIYSKEVKFNGKKIKVDFNGNTKLESEEKLKNGQAALLREVYPGIVLMDKIETLEWSKVDPNQKNYKMVLPERIDFYDSAYSLISSFDIWKNNPYLKTIPKNKVLLQFFDGEYARYIQPSERSSEVKANEYWVFSTIGRNYNIKGCNDEIQAIFYTIYGVNKAKILTFKNQVNLLNKSGKIIWKHELVEKPFTGFSISADGLIGFSYGTILSASTGRNESDSYEGYEIWDIEGNIKIYDEGFNDLKTNLQSVLCENSLFIVHLSYNGYRDPNMDTKMIIINNGTNSKYEIILNNNQMDSVTMFRGKLFKSYNDVLAKFPFQKSIIK